MKCRAPELPGQSARPQEAGQRGWPEKTGKTAQEVRLKTRDDGDGTTPSVLPQGPRAEPQQLSPFGRISNNHRLVDQKSQPSVQFSGAVAYGIVQRVKATKLPDMPTNVTTAIDFLNDIESNSSLSEMLQSIAAMQVEVLEKSAYAQHCAGLIETIKAKLPRELPPPEPEATALPKGQRYIHSIWVEGEYGGNEELAEAIKTRTGSKAAEWSNLIWVYRSAKKVDPALDDLVCRPIKLHGLDLREVDFTATMAAWRDRPAWVDRFLPLLDILLSKKSYVAMGDIMRMIVLYYKGGLYQDVKIHLVTPEAEFFDEPLVNAGKLQLVSGGSHKENWAMVAEAGCEMIEQVMEATLKQFPSAEALERYPENYAQGGKYSSAHADLHERLGPWNRIEKIKGKTDSIEDVNPSLRLKNPRAVNSWATTDEFDFNLDQPSPWREMASNIVQLPPARGRMAPQHVLLALTRERAYDAFAPNFWAAYDEYRRRNPGSTYTLSPVQVINRLDRARPTRLYIMYPGDWDRYEQFKREHREFEYE